MVLQNSGRYVPQKANPFSAGTSGGVGGAEAEDYPGDDGKTDLRFRITKENEAIDVKYGFNRVNEQFGREITGYMMNIHSAEMLDENKRLIACIDLYFVLIVSPIRISLKNIDQVGVPWVKRNHTMSSINSGKPYRFLYVTQCPR